MIDLAVPPSRPSRIRLQPAQHAAAWPTGLNWLDYLLIFMLFGYSTLGRSFSHWGISPIFIGEVALLLYMVCRPRETLGTGIAGLMRPGTLSGFSWVMLLGVAYGGIETIRGLLAGHIPSITIQCLAFHVYPIFLLIGISVGRRSPDLIARLIVPLCWATGIYGILYITVLTRIGLTDTLSNYETGWFGQPHFSGKFMLLLLSFNHPVSVTAMPLALCMFVMLGMQSRAQMVAIGLVIPLWAFLSRRVINLLAMVSVFGALLMVGWLLDVKIPSPESRHGGVISVRAIATQLYAIYDSKSVENVRDVESRAGTISWRTGWWKEIWKMVHSSEGKMLFGGGYGYPIWELHPEGTDDFPLRTPHNQIMFCLAYTGWVGVALFAVLQLSIGRAMWRAYRTTGQAAGFALWLICLLRSMFDNFFESPHFAIPLYAILGLVMAHAEGVVKRDSVEASPSAPQFHLPRLADS